MAMIKFWRCATLPDSRDADTLYFVKDNGHLYLGNDLIADVTKLDTAQVEQILGDALSSYYTKSAIDGIVNTINGEIAKKVDQTAYNTKIGEIEGAISTATSGKLDTSVYNAYVAAHKNDYTNAQIDAAIDADVKVVTDYISENEAAWGQNDNTTYTLSYDNSGDVPYIVLTPSEGEATKVDATEFIKDGMIDSVALSEDGLSLIITWNTDAGKDSTTIPLSGLVDIYTGVAGARVTVSVSSDDRISADLVAGSISKNYLDNGVQSSLEKADSAVQSGDLEPYAKTADQKTITDAISNRVTAIENLGLEAGSTYAKAADLGDLAGKDEADLELNKYAVAADIAGSLAKADSAVQPAAIADMLTKTEAATTYQVKGNYEAAGAAAAVQGATTNTVKDCVDAINTMNNQVGNTIGTVQNIVEMLTWIEG